MGYDSDRITQGDLNWGPMRRRRRAWKSWTITLVVAWATLPPTDLWPPGSRAPWVLPPLVTARPTSIAAAADCDPATEAAIAILCQSVQIRRDGLHNRLLRALRHLEDPALAPLFTALATAPQPSLVIHGIIGLSEISPERQVELELIAEIHDPKVQAELIALAMDSDRLGDDDAEQMLAWPGLDTAVKVVIATRLVESGRLTNASILHEAMAAGPIGRRSLIALLLHQIGDPAGIKGLQALDRSDDKQRDRVRAGLLQTAIHHAFSSAGPWAYAVSTEPDVDKELGVLAMRTALRFGDLRAADLWRQHYESDTNPAHRTRLAMAALEMSPWQDPALFDTLAASEDTVIAQIGRTGKAIAGRTKDGPEQVDALIQLQYPPANLWALRFARRHADPAAAPIMLLRLILAYEEGPPQGRKQRLGTAVEAAQTLYELDPQAATNMLQPILTGPKADPRLVEGILLALVRAQAPDPVRVIADLPDFKTLNANSLALLLRAKHDDKPLDDRQMVDLRLLVGSTALEPSLQVQAAWAYLKITDQKDLALAAVLGAMP